LDKLPHWADVVVALVVGGIVAVLVQLVVVRKLKKSFKDLGGECDVQSSIVMIFTSLQQSSWNCELEMRRS